MPRQEGPGWCSCSAPRVPPDAGLTWEVAASLAASWKLGKWFLTLAASESPSELKKKPVPEFHPQGSNSHGLEWGLGLRSSQNQPGNSSMQLGTEPWLQGCESAVLGPSSLRRPVQCVLFHLFHLIHPSTVPFTHIFLESIFCGRHWKHKEA